MEKQAEPENELKKVEVAESDHDSEGLIFFDPQAEIKA